jgi:hypothetical protein
MDLINNLIFTAVNNVGGFSTPPADFFNLPPELGGPAIPIPPPRPSVFPLPVNRGIFFSYNTDVIEEFCAIDDSRFIENAIQKHWADMVTGTGRNYTGLTVTPGIPTPVNATVTSFTDINPPNNLIPPYHMIYAYLVENSRIAQIFERLLFLYLHDEKLNKATTPLNREAFQWIINTENLFFKELPNASYRNITSQVRTSLDSTRRNAYFRLFGMDLAFGDLASNATVNFQKAEFNNQPFIVLFEKFITEIWQAYTNARNQVGPNTTDLFSIVDTAQKIQEMLMSRRTTETTFNNYRYFNLSKEEYSSVVMMSWFYEVVSYDSPLIQFLRCNGNTPGERLINVGKKVGINAHSKSEGLLDIAPPMNTLLRRIELGDYNPANEAQVRSIIESQIPGSTSPIQDRQALTELLLIINNWEKATGHKIKNPEANITGTVRVQQNGMKTQPAMN